MIQSVSRFASEVSNLHHPSKREVSLRVENRAPRIACDDPMAAALALVSDFDIERMTRDDLIDAIRGAQQVRHCPARAERIVDLEENDLRRVMYLVRRWMRSRLDKQSTERGMVPYFRDRL